MIEFPFYSYVIFFLGLRYMFRADGAWTFGASISTMLALFSYSIGNLGGVVLFALIAAWRISAQEDRNYYGTF